MTKYKIIICLLVMLIFAVPMVLNPLFIEKAPKFYWYEYIIVFVGFPIITWFTLNFGIRKMEEQERKKTRQ